VQSSSLCPLRRCHYRRCRLIRADHLAGLADQVGGQECTVAGPAANIEHTHAGADPRLSEELSRGWPDEAFLRTQALQFPI
jgi:hypothetical protein